MEVISAKWRKSTYSGGNGGNCVEVGAATKHVLVRDTTNRDSVVVRVPPDAWREFAERLKDGS